MTVSAGSVPGMYPIPVAHMIGMAQVVKRLFGQVRQAQRARNASVIIVNIGANDLG